MNHYLAVLLIATLSATAVPGQAQRPDHAGNGNKNGGSGQRDGGNRPDRAAPATPARPDRTVNDRSRPETGRGNQRPDIGRPDIGRPDMARPDPGRPNTTRPNTTRPDNGRPMPAPDRQAVHNRRPAPPVIIRPQYPTGNAVRPARPDYSYNRPPPGNYWRPEAGRPQVNWWQNGRWNQRPVYAPAYRYPQGYGYRRWSPGLILPSLFFGSSFFFDQFFDLGLSAPPYGYRWVRSGPDLLLVDTRTGRIRDVRYGVFG